MAAIFCNDAPFSTPRYMPGENAGLAHGLIIAQLHNAADRYAATPEGVQQLATGGVIPYNPYRQHGHAEVGRLLSGSRSALQ